LSVLRLTLVHRQASWQGLATAIAKPSVLAMSKTQPQISQVSKTTRILAASSGVRI
jgi:hypothetical protein